MTEWEPATEAEAAMRDALRANDQELYFRILARTELLLPVSAEAMAGQAAIGWGTWTTGGRTHVLAFTSVDTLRFCLGDSAGATRSVSYQELANSWPNLEWWLAVNPGLPVEGYLPAWFVSQLSRGDVRLPGRTVGSRARLEAAESVAPVGSVARARATASVPARMVSPHQGSSDGRMVRAAALPAPPEQPATSPQPTLLPTTAPPAGIEQPARSEQSPVSPAATGAAASNGATHEQHSPGPNPAPLAARPVTADSQPLPKRPLPADPAPPPYRPVSRDPAALPSGPASRADEAAAARRSEGATQTVSATEHLSDPSRFGGPGGGEDVLPGRPVNGARSYPDPGQGPTSPAPNPALLNFEPANDVEENLLAAASGGSTDSFLSTLLLAKVLLPVSDSSAPGTLPGEEGFAWQTETLDGETYVVIFTSPERLADHVTEPVETVAVKFVQLISKWPDPAWSFAVNPGTPIGAKLPGAQIVALASWAAEAGLRDDGDAEQPEPAPVEEATPRSTYAPAKEDPDRPTMMQKTIAPSQLGYYLERGYDRVSGFVHRASEVAHLTTPAKLHAALGLGYPGSPFSPTAEETYVLRWPAHRPSLYRIPYGGQNEAAMRAMEGWVIERPPFRGNGFAPGESTDVIAEFKVDSARLPHGSQLWHIGADGSETLIAVLDYDVPVWRRVGEG